MSAPANPNKFEIGSMPHPEQLYHLSNDDLDQYCEPYELLENLDLQNRELDGYIGPRITSQARWEMLVERYQPRSYLDNRLRSKNIAKDENAKMTWKSMRSGVCKYTKNMLKWIDKHNKHEYDHGGVTFVLPAGHAPVAHGQAPPIFWKDRREDRRRSANAPRQPRQPRAPRAPRVPAQRRARNNAGLAAGAGMAAQVPLPLFPGLPSSQAAEEEDEEEMMGGEN